MKIKSQSSLLTLLELTRWKEYYGSVAFVTGLGIAFSELKDLTSVATVYVANFLAVAFSFIFNELEDWNDDRFDPRRKGKPLPAVLIGSKTGYLFCAVVASASSALFALVGYWPFVFGFGSILLSFFYSWKRVRLKAQPIADLVSHGLQLGTLQFLAAATIGMKVSFATLVSIAFLIFFMSGIADLNNEIRDYVPDRKAGLRNTLSIFDLRTSAAFIQYLWLLPLGAILAIGSFRMSGRGQTLIAAVAITAIVLYLTTPKHKRRELFFYVRSQQLGAAWGLCFILFGESH